MLSANIHILFIIYTIFLHICIVFYIQIQTREIKFDSKNTLQIINSICSLPKIFVFILSRGYKNEFKCKINFKENLDMNNYYEPIDNTLPKKCVLVCPPEKPYHNLYNYCSQSCNEGNYKYSLESKRINNKPVTLLDNNTLIVVKFP